MAKKVYVAVDLGASSGRHVAGLFDGRRLELAEGYRFENGPVPAAGRLYWDLLRQWHHVRLGLRKMADAYGREISTIGLDTWGVDFGLLGQGDELLGNPYHYRDARTRGMFERAFALVPCAEVFAATGIQFMEINTLYQLLAMRVGNSPLLDQARSLLMIPDLFNWLLTGVKVNELTDATTSQCFDPRSRNWAFGLLERLGIPTGMFGTIAQPGDIVGPLRTQLADELNLRRPRLCSPARTTRPAPWSRCRLPAMCLPGPRGATSARARGR